MKVLHVINSLGQGGAEHALLDLAAALDSCGIQSEIMVLRRGGVLEARCLEAGLALRGPGYIGGEFDVVQGWLYAGSAAASLLTSRRIPVCWNMRHVLSDERESLTTRTCLMLMRRVLRARQGVANSTPALQCHADLRADAWQLIGNGVDTSRFAPDQQIRDRVRADLGITDETCVVQIARVHPHKGHEMLMSAWDSLSTDTRSDARLVLVGAGTERYARAGVLGLGARDDVPDLLCAADLLVNPSHTESAPNVVLQAMSCAVPCVVTNVGDSGRFVGATGWVCDAQRASLADALSEALDTAPEARETLGAQARARVVEHYDLAASVEAYAALFRALAGSVAGECA